MNGVSFEMSDRASVPKLHIAPLPPPPPTHTHTLPETEGMPLLGSFILWEEGEPRERNVQVSSNSRLIDDCGKWKSCDNSQWKMSGRQQRQTREWVSTILDCVVSSTSTSLYWVLQQQLLSQLQSNRMYGGVQVKKKGCCTSGGWPT